MSDRVNHPKHYTSHPSGVECIQITEHYNFTIGNAIKYLWRQGLKDEANLDPIEKQVEDCEKAIWYIKREIKNLKEGVYNGKNQQEQNETVAQGSSKNQCSRGSASYGSQDEIKFYYASDATPAYTITLNAGSDLQGTMGEETGSSWYYQSGIGTSEQGEFDFGAHGDTVITINTNAAQYFGDDLKINFDKEDKVNYYTMNGGTVWTGAPSLWTVVMKEHINEAK